jgi:hypothetical protein
MNEKKLISEKAREAYRDQQSQDTEGGCADAGSYIYGFKQGAQWMHKHLTEQAAQGFEEFWDDGRYLLTAGSYARDYEAERIWQSARLSNMKEIEELKQKLMQTGCDINKAEFKLAIAVEALDQIAILPTPDSVKNIKDEVCFYIEKAKEALTKISNGGVG